MKHAGDETLDSIDDCLTKLRAMPGLTEKRRGIFYRKSQAFLHFHEDPAGIFADIKVEGAFKRFSADTIPQRSALITLAKKLLSA